MGATGKGPARAAGHKGPHGGSTRVTGGRLRGMGLHLGGHKGPHRGRPQAKWGTLVWGGPRKGG